MKKQINTAGHKIHNVQPYYFRLEINTDLCYNETNQRESGGKMHTSVLVIDDEPELAEYTAKYFKLNNLKTTMQ